MPDFDAIFKDIQTQVVTLAETTVSKYKDEAIADGKKLLAQMKDDLLRWIDLLAEKKLKTGEFEWLVNSDKEIVKMAALEKAGLAEIRVQQFSMSVLNVIADVALKSVETKVI